MANESRWKRGFFCLIGAQFENAFTDNILKMLVGFMILAAYAGATQKTLMLIEMELFSLPFLLFSMLGGYLADRYSKRSVAVWAKGAELAILPLALGGLVWNQLWMLLAAIFLMNVQGAIFGPSKYGLLPEILPEKRLSWGNGVLELGTFVGILTGIGLGGALHDQFAARAHIPGLLMLGLGAAGFAASLGIARVRAAAPETKFRANFVGELFREIRYIRTERMLRMAVLGNIFFWFLGTGLHYNLLFYAKQVLRVSDTASGALLGALAIGIGTGSLLAGHLSGGKIEIGFIPLGAVGLTVFGTMIALGHPSYGQVAIMLGLLGFFGGFAAVPMNAIIQHTPPEDRKGGVIGAANLLSFVGIMLGPAACFLLQTAGVGPAGVFLTMGVLTAGATLCVVILLPDALLRLVLWFFTHSVYRVRVEGRDNIPEKGGALFVCNHMSFVDALLLIASTDRFIRFVMFKDFYHHPVIGPFARILKCIPISSQQRPREMISALRAASEAIREGEVVCIFAEGQITRIGQLLPFRRGMTRIMKNAEAPIIPVHLEGVWGSIFSFEKGRFLWKIPRRIPYPVTVTYGQAMPAASTPFEVRQTVQRLGTAAFAANKRDMRTLSRGFIRTARRHPLRFAMADGRVPRLRFGAALTRAVFLARRLRGVWSGQEMVGILLPPSVPGALVNLAALLLGKTPVNLNYTASNESVASCARQCGLETVITSRAFLARVPVEVPGRAVLLEDLAQAPRRSEKLAALACSWLLPARMLEWAAGRMHPTSLDDLATVIFSSGSTGDPKGVMLTHYNVAANVRQIAQVFMLEGKDRFLGILPFFHSFGFTVTLALPVCAGVGVVYHPNPLDTRAVGELAQKYAVTFLVGTPTFLQAYTRRCEPEDFGSVQYVVAGAEKLPARIADAFEDRFGIRPLEGYGCTECSPVVCVNAHDFRAAGFRQVGAKRGTIGQPLPGISVEIRHPETRQPLPPGQPGLLFVSGPNVMKGYLHQPEKTAEVLGDGWYNTGDIAILDDDGFVTISDRLSRFSKIGGEMVPHLKIEEKLQELAGAAEQVFMVTAVPDEKKGERLVVLHTLPPDKLEACLAQLASADLPALWRPRANQFFRVERLPYLGTGKLDLRGLRETAMGFSRSGRAAEA